MARRATVLLMLAAITGCGVGGQREAAPSGVSFADPPSASPSATTRASQRVQIYLIKDQQLVPTTRALAAPATVDEVLADLANVPSPAEQRRGLRTALNSPLQVTSASIDSSGVATVELGQELSQAGAAELVLTVGQIVLSVTGLRGVRAVHLSLDGQPLALPRGDGSLTTGPLQASDYASLVSKS